MGTGMEPATAETSLVDGQRSSARIAEDFQASFFPASLFSDPSPGSRAQSPSPVAVPRSPHALVISHSSQLVGNAGLDAASMPALATVASAEPSYGVPIVMIFPSFSDRG